MEMLGSGLLEKMKREGKRWAVITTTLEGKPRVAIATVDGMIFAMDAEMLEGVIPLLQKGLAHLRTIHGYHQ
jgi:hypothetical protein